MIDRERDVLQGDERMMNEQDDPGARSPLGGTGEAGRSGSTLRAARGVRDFVDTVAGWPAAEPIAVAGDPHGPLLAAASRAGTIVLDGRTTKERPHLATAPEIVIVEDAAGLVENLSFTTRVERSLFDVVLGQQLSDGAVYPECSLEVVAARIGEPPPASSADGPGASLRRIAHRAATILRVGTRMLASLSRQQVDLIFLESAAAAVVGRMQANGVLIDLSGWAALVGERTADRDRLLGVLTLAGLRNPRSDRDVHRFLCGLLQQHLPSSSDALASLGSHPLADALHRFRRLDAFVNDIGTKVLDSARTHVDGRARGHWRSLGARTGRLSCSSPNLLGIPRDPAIRSLIVAPPGRSILSIDASNAELRVAADVLADEKMLAVFARRDADLHREIYARATNTPVDQVTSDDRRRNKPMVFGAVLGMTPPGAVEYAREAYGVELSIDDAALLLRNIVGAFPTIEEWQRDVRERQPRFVESRSGRYSMFAPGAADYHARLAFRIQGTAADAMKSALVELSPVMAGLDVKLILAPHDEFVFECPAGAEEELAPRLTYAIACGFRRFLPNVRLKFEAKAGPTWAADRIVDTE